MSEPNLIHGKTDHWRGWYLAVVTLPVWLVLGPVIAVAQAQAAPGVDESSVLSTLVPAHPRLMLTEARLEDLKRKQASDETLRRCVEQVKTEADKAIALPPLEHRLVGPRLLSVSRECLRRVYALALMYRWTREERYARAVETNLLTVCAFPDWNPSHFLDTAEMSHAVGIGYDWSFDWLSEPSRATIRNALVEKGLKPGIAVYEPGAAGGWWTRSEFNWNQVCNGGMIIGALAIAETDPRHAQFIIPRAIASLPKALRSYDPDGAWMEGPGYWGYATHYTAFGLCALQTALGTDFGLSDMSGLRVTGHFPNETAGPTGLYLNYADSGERSARRPMSCMFWLANQYGDAAIRDAEHAVLEHYEANAGHVIWYAPRSRGVSAPRKLDRYFRGPVEIVVMRSAWDDPNALFVGVKGGYNQVNHGHLDLGNFELDALGVRWARDLGSDDYNLPGYWDKRAGGKRWQYYRLNSASHNVPMLAGRDQDANGVAKVIGFESRETGARVTLDLTGAYGPIARKAVRDVALANNRRAAIIRDRFTLGEPAEVLWGMTTDADISIETDGSAVLTLQGKSLHARVLEPKSVAFAAESAEQSPPQKVNKGVKRLVLRSAAPVGDLTIAVLLAPVWPDGPVTAPDLSVLE